jgi:DNA replicative helicase MCM subunit Mcm2 (Cdc46/Mcm family)
MENTNNKKYNPEKSHQYYLTHLSKNNEKIKCKECGIVYQYYSKSRHLKSKTHINAVNLSNNIKENINNKFIDVFKFNNELSEEQIKKIDEIIKKPEIINAFTNLIIEAFDNKL